jgi:hypothetical protein
MGLTAFFVTIVGGVFVFGIPSYFLLLEAQKAGFPLDNTLAGVIIVAVSIGLLMLWPVSWLLRFLYYKVRKKEMPPVRPSLEVPKWMVLVTKITVTLITLFSVFTLFSVAFLRIATIGYLPVLDGPSAVGSSSALGIIKLTHLSDDALPLRDIEVVSSIDGRWSVQAQSEELWLVSAYILEFPQWIRPFTEKVGLKSVARLGTLSSKAGLNMSVQPVLALGEETVTEYMLLTAGKHLPFFSFSEIVGKPVTFGKIGQVISVNLSNGAIMMSGGSAVNSSSGAHKIGVSGSLSDDSDDFSDSGDSSQSGDSGDSSQSGDSGDSSSADGTTQPDSDDDFELGDD